MNYIKQLNAFEELSGRLGLSCYAQVIYYKVLAANNKSGWCEWFESTNQYLMYKSGMTCEKTFVFHRDVLCKSNLLLYKKGGKGKPGKYSLVRLYFDEDDGDDTGSDTDIYKLKQTKQTKKIKIDKKNKEIKKVNKEAIDFERSEVVKLFEKFSCGDSSLLGELLNFCEVNGDLLETRHDAELVLDSLAVLADDSFTRKLIVRQSLDNGWTGFKCLVR